MTILLRLTSIAQDYHGPWSVYTLRGWASPLSRVDISVMATDDKLAKQRLGARLRAIRDVCDLTQDQVGERAGFSGKYVSEIERGLRDVPFMSLLRIVEDGLGACIDDAVAGVTRTKKPGHQGAVPKDVEEVAARIARLPAGRRAQVLALVRGLVQIAE